MDAYEILKQLEDYKKNQSKIEKHLHKFSIIKKSLIGNQNFNFLISLVHKEFEKTINDMNLEIKTVTFTLNVLNKIKNEK